MNGFRRFLQRLGRSVRARTAFALKLAALTFAVLRDAPMPGMWRRTARSEFHRSLRQSVGGAVGTIVVTAVLIGVAMIAQGLYWLTTAGQQSLVGTVLVTVLVRELAPLLVGVILLGRSGTVALSEFGTMRSNGEEHVMESLGLDPYQLLLLPRAVAYALASFTLGMVFVIVAIITGHLLGSLAGYERDTALGLLSRVLSAMAWQDFAVFPTKLLLIGILVAASSYLTGFGARRTGDVTQLLPLGFVRAITAILICSLMLSLVA